MLRVFLLGVATSSLFHEPISPLQWTGSMFIMIGIFLAQGS
jgi:drug/metabolite transporter (DMT)-like permease